MSDETKKLSGKCVKDGNNRRSEQKRSKIKRGIMEEVEYGGRTESRRKKRWWWGKVPWFKLKIHTKYAVKNPCYISDERSWKAAFTNQLRVADWISIYSPLSTDDLFFNPSEYHLESVDLDFDMA